MIKMKQKLFIIITFILLLGTPLFSLPYFAFGQNSLSRATDTLRFNPAALSGNYPGLELTEPKIDTVTIDDVKVINSYILNRSEKTPFIDHI